jgi:hypothetical protein
VSGAGSDPGGSWTETVGAVCWIAEDAISAFAATSMGRAVLDAAGSESACSTSWWSGEPIDALSMEFRGAAAVAKSESCAVGEDWRVAGSDRVKATSSKVVPAVEPDVPGLGPFFRVFGTIIEDARAVRELSPRYGVADAPATMVARRGVGKANTTGVVSALPLGKELAPSIGVR